LHNIGYYFGYDAKNDQQKTQSKLDKDQFEKVLNDYSPYIRAIFVGHYHQEIGSSHYHEKLGGVPIMYSGSPISGRFLKVKFDASQPESCIEVNKVTTTKDEITSLKTIDCPTLN